MTKKKKCTMVIAFVFLLIFICALGIIIKNKYFSSDYDQLNDADKKMLGEYNQLYETIQSDKLWSDFDLADKTILAVSKDSLNTYLINPKDFSDNLLTKKINMPDDFRLQSVYRIAPIAPQALKIRLDAGNFNTIGKEYPAFGNQVYFIKYDEEDSLEKPYSSSHFTPLLTHEAFHYYMQNEWKIVENPENPLTEDVMTLLKDQYQVLDNIRAELKSGRDRDVLIDYARQYVDIVSKRMENNKEYVLSELSRETAEGTAQYLTIKVSKIIGYDYGVMYFDNIQDVPFMDAFTQIDAGKLSVNYLYDQMPYHTGAQLCLLFDELNIPDWQEKLNSQTLDKEIYLYDVLQEYLSNL